MLGSHIVYLLKKLNCGGSENATSKVFCVGIGKLFGRD